MEVAFLDTSALVKRYHKVEAVLKYSLKTLDFLQIALALKLKEYNPLFVSFDKKLAKVAEIEGFRVLDVQ
ncbi:MAG: hypothetical protein QXP28_04610 [Archaeoglobaceae archaeon]